LAKLKSRSYLFQGRTFESAFEKAQAKFGDDVAVLETRKISTSGILGFGKKTGVQIRVSVDPEVLRIYRKEMETLSREAREKPGPRTQKISDRWLLPQFRAVPADENRDVISSNYSGKLPKVFEQILREKGIDPGAVAERGASGSPGSSLVSADIVSLLRQMQGQLDEALSRPPVGVSEMPTMGRVSPSVLVEELKGRLQDLDVPEEVARNILVDCAGNGPWPKEARPLLYRNFLSRLLGPVGKICGGVTLRPGRGRPTVVALIGPTGVGKTTTLAKLAASFIQAGRRVGFLTLDLYRIAAVDQLKRYASIMHAPCREAETPDQVREAMKLFAEEGLDLVLIDTAGRSWQDAQYLEELRVLLAAAQPDEVYLVVSASMNARAALKSAAAFKSIRTDRLILTKTDEALNLGLLISLVFQAQIPVGYLAHHQQVHPDNIEPVSVERLGKLLIREVQYV